MVLRQGRHPGAVGAHQRPVGAHGGECARMGRTHGQGMPGDGHWRHATASHVWPPQIWFPLVWFATYRSILKGIHFLSLELRQVFHRARCRIDAWRGIPPTKIEVRGMACMRPGRRHLPPRLLVDSSCSALALAFLTAGRDVRDVLLGLAPGPDAQPGVRFPGILRGGPSAAGHAACRCHSR